MDYVNCLFSVDYFWGDGYIDTRALIGFSFLCVLARAFMLAALQWFSVANIALVYRPNKTVPPGQRRERFFLSIFLHILLASTVSVNQFRVMAIAVPTRPISSSHLIPRLLAYGFTFCYSATRISISPRSSPRFPRHGGRGGYGYDATDVSCLPRAVGDGWQQWRNGCDVVIA